MPRIYIDGIYIGGINELEATSDCGDLRIRLQHFSKFQVRNLKGELGQGTTNRNRSVPESALIVEFRTEDIVNIAMDLVEWLVEHVAVTEFKLKMILQNFNARIVIKTVPLIAASASNLLIFTR